MALLQIQRDAIGFEELNKAFAQTQEVLMRVAQYSQPIREVEMMCDHPQQIIDLHWQITDLQTKQFLPLQCEHCEMEQQIQTLMNQWDEARRILAAAGTDEVLPEELAELTRDGQRSGEEVRGLRMQLVNTLTLAARAAPAAPQDPEDRG